MQEGGSQTAQPTQQQQQQQQGVEEQQQQREVEQQQQEEGEGGQQQEQQQEEGEGQASEAQSEPPTPTALGGGGGEEHQGEPPTPTALGALLVLGVCSGVSQMMVARAYALAPVSALAPFDYSSMVWAVLFGWLVFGETPHLAAMQGAVVIAAAGLYSLHGEQSRHRREKSAA